MKSNLQLVGTLLRKDLRLFGPFAALIAALLALWQFPGIVVQLGVLGALIQTGLQLGTVLLVLVVCYEDAVVSLKHDWLTRPVPGLMLLLAKSIFVVLATMVPAILGTFAFNLTQGNSLAEALLAALSSGVPGDRVLIYATVMAFAAVTANVRQAVIVFLASLAAMAVVTVTWSTLHQVPESQGATSSGWVVKRSMELLLMLTAAPILWIQYRHRHTKAARAIAAVAAVGGTAIVTCFTWSPVFAIQKMLAPDPGAAASVQTVIAAGCFPARVLDATQGAVTDATAGLTAQRYSEEHRKAAGAGAIAFSTRLLRKQFPAGNLLTVNHVVVSYFGAGLELQRLRPGRTSSRMMPSDDAKAAADHYWLLSDADAKRLLATPGVETRLDYSLSLLAPKHSAQFAADGRRSYYAGIGFCGASVDRSAGTVSVSCFKPGAQPALLVANLDGTADSAAVTSRQADFTPAWLDFWGGSRHTMQLAARGAAAPRVKVTAYEARAHFDRQIVIPGVLGGTAATCPVPSVP